MRILLVSQMYPGPDDPDLGSFVAQLEHALRARGHEIDLAVLDRRAGGKLRFLELRKRVRAAPLPDVVWAHFLVPAGLFASKVGAPLVVTAHGRDVRTIGAIPGVAHLTREVVRRASTVIAVSEYLRHELEERLPEARGKTEVVDSGVDLERFRQVEPAEHLESRAQRPVAGERQRHPSVELRERVREPHDVLALAQRADAEVTGRAFRRGRDGEALEVDTARHDLGFTDRIGELRLQLAPQVLGHADDGPCTADDQLRRRTHARQLADVAHVASVRGDHERRAAGERGDQSARDEEVRVHDVRPRRTRGTPRELEVAELSARARVEHGALDLVPALDECALDLRDECAEIGSVRAGIHLRHEQDPHPRSVSCRSCPGSSTSRGWRRSSRCPSARRACARPCAASSTAGGARCARSTASPSTSSRARWSASSGRTARARRRR